MSFLKPSFLKKQICFGNDGFSFLILFFLTMPGITSVLQAKARRPVPGKSEEVYSISKAAPVPIAAKKTKLPLIVYGESAGASSTYIPSGFMGDSESMKVRTVDFSAPLSPDKQGTSCLMVEIKPQGREGWVGLYWQTPANNWGKIKGAGYDLTAVQKLSFYARGEKGGEKITEVKMGGLIGPYPDTDVVTLGPIRLNKEWTKYSIDLAGRDLRHILGGFAFSVRRSDNPRGATFYLDEIIFEGDPNAPVEMIAPVAMEPVPAPTPTPAVAESKPFKPIKIVVPFSNAKTAFTGAGKEGLDEIAAVAAKSDALQVLVEGHTDNVGSRELNLKLSLEHAKAVADYLISKGVSRDQITMDALGGDVPIRDGSNNTAQGRMENRRVEVSLVPK